MSPDAPSTTAYASNATIAELGDRLRDARRVALTSHAKPDGDAIGSVLGLARALEALGARATVHLAGPIEPPLRALAEGTALREIDGEPLPDDCDAIVVADTGAWSQLGLAEPWLRANHERVLGLDHHARGDDVAALRYVDATAAATAMLVVDLLDAMGCELTGGRGGVAEPLFVGLATDTGWFRHPSADARAFAVAARLLERGVDKSRLYQLIEETHRPRRLAVEAAALGSIEFALDGAAALMTLRRADFERAGATFEDLTGVVNMPMVVGAVRVAVLLAQAEPGQTKLSFRSKPAVAGELEIDVNRLAQRFGGGGHRHAAGARVEQEIDDARDAVRAALAAL